uniref:Set domain protein 110 n=2 Tax=Tetraselmis sp. GSL018 TaxID=582737 RepID=A0A061SJB3_9CHLO|mmetsp:Transcript_6811/g.16435  ORF Transcript_6811/g.16435 Transcript_6811/m.16435 type:complete len:1556 (+) Transcript_6811:557-5224(+)
MTSGSKEGDNKQEPEQLLTVLGSQELVNAADTCKVLWAKVKGHPFWPAQIMSNKAADEMLKGLQRRKDDAAPVQFFGTLEIAWTKGCDTVRWEQGMANGLFHKGKTKRHFLTSLEQVQSFLLRRKAPSGWWGKPPDKRTLPPSSISTITPRLLGNKQPDANGATVKHLPASSASSKTTPLAAKAPSGGKGAGSATKGAAAVPKQPAKEEQLWAGRSAAAKAKEKIKQQASEAKDAEPQPQQRRMTRNSLATATDMDILETHAHEIERVATNYIRQTRSSTRASKQDRPEPAPKMESEDFEGSTHSTESSGGTGDGVVESKQPLEVTADSNGESLAEATCGEEAGAQDTGQAEDPAGLGAADVGAECEDPAQADTSRSDGEAGGRGGADGAGSGTVEPAERIGTGANEPEGEAQEANGEIEPTKADGACRPADAADASGGEEGPAQPQREGRGAAEPSSDPDADGPGQSDAPVPEPVAETDSGLGEGHEPAPMQCDSPAVGTEPFGLPSQSSDSGNCVRAETLATELAEPKRKRQDAHSEEPREQGPTHGSLMHKHVHSSPAALPQAASAGEHSECTGRVSRNGRVIKKPRKMGSEEPPEPARESLAKADSTRHSASSRDSLLAVKHKRDASVGLSAPKRKTAQDQGNALLPGQPESQRPEARSVVKRSPSPLHAPSPGAPASGSDSQRETGQHAAEQYQQQQQTPGRQAGAEIPSSGSGSLQKRSQKHRMKELPNDCHIDPDELHLDDLPSYEAIKRNIYLTQERPKRLAKSKIQVCSCKPFRNAAGTELMGCTHDCLNAASFLTCDTRLCPCGMYCRNKPFYLRPLPRLRVFHTGNRGWGVKTVDGLKKGEFICEYVGEVINWVECNKRIMEAKSIGSTGAAFYMMELQPGLVIDARRKGNLARMLNSSCDPNAETRKWHDSGTGETHIVILAKRDIEPGEELTYDYQFEHYGLGEMVDKYKCLCGAPTCRGTMDFQPEKRKDFGRRIEVWWEPDGRYYRGTVRSFNPRTGKHVILYDDNNEERISLGEVPHRWLDISAPMQPSPPDVDGHSPSHKVLDGSTAEHSMPAQGGDQRAQKARKVGHSWGEHVLPMTPKLQGPLAGEGAARSPAIEPGNSHGKVGYKYKKCRKPHVSSLSRHAAAAAAASLHQKAALEEEEEDEDAAKSLVSIFHCSPLGALESGPPMQLTPTASEPPPLALQTAPAATLGPSGTPPPPMGQQPLSAPCSADPAGLLGGVGSLPILQQQIQAQIAALQAACVGPGQINAALQAGLVPSGGQAPAMILPNGTIMLSAHPSGAMAPQFMPAPVPQAFFPPQANPHFLANINPPTVPAPFPASCGAPQQPQACSMPSWEHAHASAAGPCSGEPPHPSPLPPAAADPFTVAQSSGGGPLGPQPATTTARPITCCPWALGSENRAALPAAATHGSATPSQSSAVPTGLPWAEASAAGSASLAHYDAAKLACGAPNSGALDRGLPAALPCSAAEPAGSSPRASANPSGERAPLPSCGVVRGADEGDASEGLLQPEGSVPNGGSGAAAVVQLGEGACPAPPLSR